jgi:hypothetical protein
VCTNRLHGWELVPALTPGLSLADLAVRLRDAGYTVGEAHEGDPWDFNGLVVAEKEPA